MVPKELFFFLNYKILWSSAIANILILYLRFFFIFFQKFFFSKFFFSKFFFSKFFFFNFFFFKCPKWTRSQLSDVSYVLVYFFFEKIYRGKLSKLSVSYYVLITKTSFLGHFCVTHSLTHSQTHKLTNSQTDSQTHKRKVCLTELHVAAKEKFFGDHLRKKKKKRVKKNSIEVSFLSLPFLNMFL